MLIALLSEFARAESETMGVRIQSVMEAKRAKGEWLTGKPPFGYEMAEDKHLRPVEPGASAMRHVFEMVIAGQTLYAVCAYLNDRGLRNARGQQFTVTAIWVRCGRRRTRVCSRRGTSTPRARTLPASPVCTTTGTAVSRCRA